jgi:hypothetical protein
MSSVSTRYPMQSVVIRTPRHTVPTGITAASFRVRLDRDAVTKM